MNEFIYYVLSKYEMFIFVLIRISGIFIISPIFNNDFIPKIFKIGFAFFFSLIITDVLNAKQIDYNNLGVLSLVLKELIVGFIVGFISYLFFTAVYVLGQIVDMEIGFGMVNVLDPQNKEEMPIMGNFYYILAILVFFVIDGHHMLIKGLVDSFTYIPIGTFELKSAVMYQVVGILGKVFVIGFKISSPILAALFLANVLLGILARTMPQMNVFIVGMPFKIFIGLFVILFTLPLFIIALQHMYNNMYEEIFNFLKVFKKG